MQTFRSAALALLALGFVATSAFPYGSYLKSLSKPQPPLEPESKGGQSTPSTSKSTWDDYNPNPLSAKVGGPVMTNDSEKTLSDGEDSLLGSSNGQTSPTTNGFGLPPSIATGPNNSASPSRTVDPYAAAYAAFTKNSPAVSSGTVATVNFSVASAQTEAIKNEEKDPYAAMEVAITTSASEASKKQRGLGSSYLDALASPLSSNAANEEVPVMETKPVFSGSSLNDVAAVVVEQETDIEDESPVIPQVVNPFATGSSDFSLDLNSLAVPSPPEPQQAEDSKSKKTFSALSYLENLTNSESKKKPFAARSYLENLPTNPTVENDTKPIPAADVAIPLEETQRSTMDVSSSSSSQRPLIPIHAAKAVEIVSQEYEDRPFFASFLPKAPVRARGRPPVPKDLTKSRLERIMSRTSDSQAVGAGGASTYAAFERAEDNWSKLKASKPFTYDSRLLKEGAAKGNVDSPLSFVSDDVANGSPRAWKKLRSLKGKKLDFDAVVCGGTLGIFFATALALKGHRVCVLEAGELRGREQEWNISMEELKELVRIGVLTDDDIEASVTTEFPGCRAGFKNKEVANLNGGYQENEIGYECFTPGVLNLGVSPAILLERVQKRFLSLGGQIKEQTPLEGVVVSEIIGSALDLGEKKQPITSRLVIDCMGNASPISRQQRFGKKPDGVCAVVGSCAAGFAPETNTIGDIIYTNSEIKDCGRNGKLQYFWEAFPVGIGRNGKEPGTSDVKTTYMFTYFDADEHRPSLGTLMEDYFDMLPTYQKSIVNAEDDLDFKRVLFAFFPTYQDSPLKPQWSRVLAVGDASGIQSPLSFGGFGSLTRHLDRITTAISEALEDDLLNQDDLAEINAYQPNLSAAWMFQKAMSIRMGQDSDSKFINRLLATNFEVMNEQGPRVIKPFLQDVVRFDGLASSLSGSFVKDPSFMPDIVKHVGIVTLAQWICHVAMMGVYAFLHAVVTPLLSPFVRMFKTARERFQWRRRMDSWKYGSGSDFVFPPEEKTV